MKDRKLIEKRLRELLPKASARPKTLHSAMRYSVFSGGKRLRPILALEACRLSGGKTKDALDAACAIEMVHTYSLIHDDLPSMDNDDYRRGKLSCHKKYGEATAILAGDALLTRAFGILARIKKRRVLNRAVTEFAKAIGSLGMVGGQEADLKSRSSLTKKKSGFITEHKTASLFKASMLLGAIFGSANTQKEQALTRFGLSFGMAFQLMDDSFDSDGYARIIGKRKTKNMALEFAKRANAQLRIFGKKADKLRALTKHVIARSEATKQSRTSQIALPNSKQYKARNDGRIHR